LGVLGVRSLAVGATGFVHAISPTRIVTQIMERYFIQPPFPEIQGGGLCNELKSIGRAACDSGGVHWRVSANTLSD
jgi:hypothetical protein